MANLGQERPSIEGSFQVGCVTFIFAYKPTDEARMLRPKLSFDDYSLVIRTDFSDEAAWQLVCAAIQSPQTTDGFQAMVECISDPTCNGLSPDGVCRLVPDTDAYLFVFIVDAHALADPQHPVLVVDTEDSSLQFRVVPQAAWAVENNLRLANMGFDDFEAALGDDGVYRGIGH